MAMMPNEVAAQLRALGVREGGVLLVHTSFRAEAGLQREGKVGHAHARLADSKDVVEMAVRRLRADPTVFLCPAPERCAECDLARASMGRA